MKKTDDRSADRQLIDRLKRYKQFRDGEMLLTDILTLVSGTRPLDFSLFAAFPSMSLLVGNCQLQLANVFLRLFADSFDVSEVDPSAPASDVSSRIGLTLRAHPKRAVGLFVTVAYMVEHAPDKLDAAISELFLEAQEFAMAREKESRKGRPTTKLPKRVADSRTDEDRRIRERLSQDNLGKHVAAAVRLGAVTKEDVADKIGVDARTLQRWAKPKGGWKAVVSLLRGDKLKK